MPDIAEYTEYVIKLTEKEHRLVGLALIRELSKAEDVTAAAELNRKLLEGRVRGLKSKLESAEGALRKAVDG